MRDLHDMLLLSQRPEAYIAICTCCGNISFMYRNIAITFQHSEFEYFCQYFDNLKGLKSEETDDVYMSTPVKNILFCFTKSEIKEIKQLLTEANLLLETYKILGVDFKC
ncbi:MAG TPA: DUF6686 family protein [Cytophagaceae bacterium]